MSTIGELWVKLKASTDDFEAKMETAEKKADKFGKGFKAHVGQSLQDVGKTMTVAGVGIIASIGGIVAAGAEWSAQVEGQKFLYNNLDKEVQSSIASNAKNAQSIGLTSQQYKNGATDISTYYKNMGLTADKTVELSGKTMDLVADLGAVKDVPFDEALGDFKSALMGNYEAVDKYGISLSASTLENSEFVKSLGKSWNKLSDNEKMMAAYSEITRQGASAQGLAKQEAEGFGMKMKYLKQQISETVGQIGENLLPVLEPLIKKLSEAVQKMSEWVKENPELTKTILLVVGGLGMFLATAGPLMMVIGGIIVAVGAFNVAMLPVYGTVLGVVIAIGLLVAAGIALWQNWDTIKAKLIELKDYLLNKWEEIKTQSIQKINELKEKSIAYIKDKINSIKQTMSELPGKIREAWENAKQSMISKASEMVNSARQKITEKINAIREKATGIKTNISNAWNDAISYLKGINLFSIGSDIIKGMINGIKSMAGNVVGAISGVVTGAVNAAKKKLGINSPSKVFMEFGKYTGEGLAIGIDKENKRVSKASSSLSDSVVGGYSANLKSPKLRTNTQGLQGANTMQDNKPIIIQTMLDGKVVAETITSYLDLINGQNLMLAERGLI